MLTKVTYAMIDGETANVLDFGADPTGAADSAAAFTAALAASGYVYVPAGTYKIASTIVIGSNKILTGPQVSSKAWQGGVTINHTGAGKLFNCNSTSYGGIYIGNFRIVGGSGDYAISSIQSKAVFERLYFDQYNGSGIELRYAPPPGAWGTIITECEYLSVTTPNAYRAFQIDVDGGNGIAIRNCSATYGSIGINVDRVEGLVIDGFNSTGQTDTYSTLTAEDQCAIRLSGSGFKKAITIQNCYLENFTYGIYVEKVNGLTIQSNFIDSVGKPTNEGSCIFLKTELCNNVTINNNFIENRQAAPSNCVVVDSTVNCLVTNNWIISDGTDSLLIDNTYGSPTVTLQANYINPKEKNGCPAVSSVGDTSPSIHYTGLTDGGYKKIANSTATTVVTLSSAGLYMVWACVQNSALPNELSAYAVISHNGTNSYARTTSDGANLSISLSGNNVQVTQTAGSDQVIKWAYQRLDVT